MLSLESTIALNGNPFNFSVNSIMSSGGEYAGPNSLKGLTNSVRKLYDEVRVEIIPKFDKWLMQKGSYLERIEPDNRYLGIFTNLSENVRGLCSKLKLGYEGSGTLIMLSEYLAQEFNLGEKVQPYYTMFHEMLHGLYRLGERATYATIPKFFKDLAANTTGKLKSLYQEIAYLAYLAYEGYKRNPYESASVAKALILKAGLSYLNEKLEGATGKERKELLAVIEEMNAELVDAEDKGDSGTNDDNPSGEQPADSSAEPSDSSPD